MKTLLYAAILTLVAFASSCSEPSHNVETFEEYQDSIKSDSISTL